MRLICRDAVSHVHLLDIIGNNPQISLTLAPHCVWCSAGVTQIQFFQEKIGENLRHLRINLSTVAITDKVYFTGSGEKILL